MCEFRIQACAATVIMIIVYTVKCKLVLNYFFIGFIMKKMLLLTAICFFTFSGLAHNVVANVAAKSKNCTCAECKCGTECNCGK